MFKKVDIWKYASVGVVALAGISTASVVNKAMEAVPCNQIIKVIGQATTTSIISLAWMAIAVNILASQPSVVLDGNEDEVFADKDL